jgi:hypothetical protein
MMAVLVARSPIRQAYTNQHRGTFMPELRCSDNSEHLRDHSSLYDHGHLEACPHSDVIRLLVADGISEVAFS